MMKRHFVTIMDYQMYGYQRTISAQIKNGVELRLEDTNLSKNSHLKFLY